MKYWKSKLWFQKHNECCQQIKFHTVSCVGEWGSILKKFWHQSRIKRIGPMPRGALKIPPVFHAISDTSLESLHSLILGAAALLLSCVWNDLRMKLTGVGTVCSEL